MSTQVIKKKIAMPKKQTPKRMIELLPKKEEEIIHPINKSKFTLESLVKKKASNNKVAPLKDVSETPANNTNLQYQNYSDVLNKVTTEEQMSRKEMQQLHKQIKGLDQEAHVEICRILIEELGTEFLMVNNYGTYIDLAELPDKVLWRISYYIKLCQEDTIRRKIKLEAEKQWQQDLQENQQYQQMKQAGSGSHPNIFHQTVPHYSTDQVPTYQDLRQDALRNLMNSQEVSVGSYGMVADFMNGSGMIKIRNDETDTNADEIATIDDQTETEIGEPSEIDEFD